MPKRGEEVEQKPTRQRKSAEPKEVKKEETTTGTGKVVRKSPLEASFRKMCEAAEPGLSSKINDVSERFVKDGDEKVAVLFATFAKDGVDADEVDDDFNKDCIKTVLFHYHTGKEEQSSSKAQFLEVLPPEGEDSIHLLCFHEE